MKILKKEKSKQLTISEKKDILKKLTIAFIIINFFDIILSIWVDDNDVKNEIIMYSIGIIINFGNLYLLRFYEKKKWPVILVGLENFFSGFIVFFGEIYVLYLELSLDKGDIKKELPKINMNYSSKPAIFIIGFIIVLIVFYSSLLSRLGVHVDYNKYWQVALIYGIQFLILAIPLKKDILENFKYFKSNLGVYLKYILKYFGIFMMLQIIINIILFFIIGETPTNEATVDELPLVLKAILASLIAPITEELMFRGWLRKAIKNDKIFIVISGLIFGILHIWYKEENPLMYLYGITYVTMGCVLAKSYTKTNNIFTNMGIHFANNTLSVIAEIALKFL